MSKAAPYESVKVNFQDLERYAIEDKGASQHKVTNWLSLYSQLRIEVLKALRDGLAHISNQTVEQLREEYSSELLRDLQKLSNREELNNQRSKRDGIPNFNQNFYDEIKQPPSTWSDEFEAFLKSYSQLSSDGHFIEKISAQMLLEFGKPGSTISSLQSALSQNILSYKHAYSDQTKKDLGPRELIMIKDQSGQTKSLTFDELSNSPAIHLTGEQRDFIKSTWQQGSFANGWFVLTHWPSDSDLTNANLNPIAPLATNSTSRDWCLIDLSEPDKVIVKSRPHVELFKNEDRTERGSQAQAVLEVDISDLRDNEYIPGCASSKPKIQAYIYSFVPEIGNKLPPLLKASTSLEFDGIRQIMIKDCLNGALDEILTVGNKSGIALDHLLAQMGQQESEEFIFQALLHSDKSLEEKRVIWDHLKLEQKDFFDDQVRRELSLIEAEKAYNSIIEDKPILNDPNRLNFIPRDSLNLSGENIDLTIAKDKEAFNKGEITENILLPRLAIEFYSQIEPNFEKREAFAQKQLSEYLKTQTQLIDSKEKDKLKNAIVKILEPLSQTDQEKTMLQNNAGKLVRECASQAGKKMSWGQLLQREIDKIKNFVKFIFGRENVVQTIIEKHPDIINSFKTKAHEARPKSFIEREDSRERSNSVISREH